MVRLPKNFYSASDLRGAIALAIEEYLEVDERPSLPVPLTWLQRVHLEHKELADKVQALKLYMMTDTFKQLSKAERQNLETQSRHMHGYLSVLDARIAYYEVTR